MMMRISRVLPIGLLMTACATVPTGPSLMVMPGDGKTFEQFQADDAVCRQWAAQQTGTTTSQASSHSTLTGAAIGTVLGAAAGAALGAASGHAGTGAAVGGGVGLLGGTAVGASNASGAQTTVQHRYDMAYTQCMYAKGNQVPMTRGYQPTYTRRTLPPPPSASVPMAPPPPPAGPPPPAPPGLVR